MAPNPCQSSCQGEVVSQLAGSTQNLTALSGETVKSIFCPSDVLVQQTQACSLLTCFSAKLADVSGKSSYHRINQDTGRLQGSANGDGCQACYPS